MGILIFNASPYGLDEIFILSFFLLLLHMILTFNISSDEEHLWTACLLTLSGENSIVYYFFDLRYKALGNNSLFLTINFKIFFFISREKQISGSQSA